jgi:hypothetical protein
MPLPNIIMQAPSGVDVPTQVHLPDGTTVKPAANGQITVSSKFLHVMLSAGFQVVVTGGTTHVP